MILVWGLVSGWTRVHVGIVFAIKNCACMICMYMCIYIYIYLYIIQKKSITFASGNYSRCFLRSFLPPSLPSFLPSFFSSFLPSFLSSFLPPFLPSFLPDPKKKMMPKNVFFDAYASLAVPIECQGMDFCHVIPRCVHLETPNFTVPHLASHGAQP